MSRIRLCLAAAALATATLSLPAEASGARGCVDFGTATFDNRVTTTYDSNNGVTFSYSMICAGADHMGGSGTQVLVPSGRSYDMSGSCTSASLTGPNTTGVLVGGVAGVTVTLFAPWPTAGTRTYLLVPTDTLGNPCNMKTAFFVAVGADVVL